MPWLWKDATRASRNVPTTSIVIKTFAHVTHVGCPSLHPRGYDVQSASAQYRFHYAAPTGYLGGQPAIITTFEGIASRTRFVKLTHDMDSVCHAGRRLPFRRDSLLGFRASQPTTMRVRPSPRLIHKSHELPCPRCTAVDIRR